FRRVLFRSLAVPIGEDEIHITASFGVAAFPESQGADGLMTAADLALYSAKRHGKDRVVTVNPESPGCILPWPPPGATRGGDRRGGGPVGPRPGFLRLASATLAGSGRTGRRGVLSLGIGGTD